MGALECTDVVWFAGAVQHACHAGYHYNADTQMYFDSKTGGYYSSTDSKWYLYDSNSQQFQEWQH